MTAARVERIAPDPWLAAGFLKQAVQFESSSAGLPPESQQVLLHQSVIAACDAVLAFHGRRVTGSEGGHQLRIHETRGLLTGDHDELFDTLDEARQLRNNVSYAAGIAVPADVDETATAVRRLLELVVAHVSPQLPEWL